MKSSKNFRATNHITWVRTSKCWLRQTQVVQTLTPGLFGQKLALLSPRAPRTPAATLGWRHRRVLCRRHAGAAQSSPFPITSLPGREGGLITFFPIKRKAATEVSPNSRKFSNTRSLNPSREQTWSFVLVKRVGIHLAQTAGICAFAMRLPSPSLIANARYFAGFSLLYQKLYMG